MRKRPTQFTPEKRAKFFKRLAQGYTIEESARYAGTNRHTVWEIRKVDPEFEAQFKVAYEAGTDAIEDALVKRGKESDTTAAIFILKSRNRQRFGDRFGVDFSRATPEQIVDAIANMSDEQLAAILAKRSNTNG